MPLSSGRRPVEREARAPVFDQKVPVFDGNMPVFDWRHFQAASSGPHEVASSSASSATGPSAAATAAASRASGLRAVGGEGVVIRSVIPEGEAVLS